MSGIMTTEEAARYLKIHPATLRKHAETGEIPAVRVGRIWRFRKDWIDTWLTGRLDIGNENDS